MLLMGISVEITPANEAHAEGISKVICDALLQVNAKDYPPKEIDRLVDNFSTFRILDLLKHRLTFVALLEREIVGTGALQDDEIKSVFVSPDLHGMGIGRALMSVLENAASEQGRQLLTVSSSLSAVRFYASMGYSERCRRFYGKEETVQMTKAIESAYSR